MATRNVATVIGGSGFIGRYVVQRLAAKGYVVRVGCRDTEVAKDLMVTGMVGQVVPFYVSLANRATVARAVANAELVVNAVGILAERHKGDFDRVQAEGAGVVAQEAASAGVGRLVHLSAIGADPQSSSNYARTKGLGETSVREAFPAATVLRPSIVFGAEDQFFNRFAAMAMYLPVMPVICGATKFQPVYVGDVADSVMAGLERDDAVGKTFELGGPRVYSFREILTYILHETHRHRPLLTVPMGLASFQARLAERLPGKPFTTDQLKLLQQDNVAAAGAPGLPALGIVPTPIELVVPSYLDRFRPGGGRREIMPA